jgi:alpha-methylacyl-CoA racemase
MTGWGQDGPWADRVGHDINYLGLTGTLSLLGRAGERPQFPANLVADYGGGSMFLLVGVLAALVERQASGRGQVVDAAMVDGVSVLTQLLWSLRAQGEWGERGTNLLDGGAPFYDVYTCADGRHVAVGALEPQFYRALLDGLDLAGEDLPAQDDRAGWPRLREVFTAAFALRGRDEWSAVFDGTAACVTPVLDPEEATAHPHLAARGTLVDVGGAWQAAPAPRFSRTPPAPPAAPGPRGGDGRPVLEEWRRGRSAAPAGDESIRTIERSHHA